MMKILISDDSLTVRKVIEMLLKPLEYVLIFSETGKDTISKAMGEQINLAIVDYSLPDMVGTQVTKEIKKVKPMVSTLLMISNREHEPTSKLLEGMCDDFIEKPFDSQTFLDKVDVLLKKSLEKPTTKPVELVEELALDKGLIGNINIDIGEEFISSQSTKKIETMEELEIPSLEGVTTLNEKNIENIEEIELIEEIEEYQDKLDEDTGVTQRETEVENVEEISIDELLKDDIETLSIVNNESKDIDASDIIEDKEESKDVEEKIVVREEKTSFEEEKSIDLEDFFSDLNEILLEDKKESKSISEKDMVVPVIEEVAKELKELETIKEKEKEDIGTESTVPIQKIEERKEQIEEDIWNFDLDISRKAVSGEDAFTTQKLEDLKDIKNMVREITYDIVEKIAWEIVPEIVDTIIKDKFSKKS